MTLEQLLILAVLLLIPLFRFVARVLGQRPPVPPPVATEPGPLPPPPPGRAQGPPGARESLEIREGSRGAPRPAPPPAAARRRAPAWLGGPAEVRRGIVLMTILGPCRALEPSHGPSQSPP